jgi:hypothetical protein
MSPLERLAAGGIDAGCASCAYRKGSETRNEPTNLIKATICAEAGVPFHCHVRSSVPLLSAAGKPVVCAGWKAEVRERAKDPEWRRQRQLKHWIGASILLLIDQLCSLPPGHTHTVVLGQLKRELKMLYAKRPLRFGRPTGRTRDGGDRCE